MGIYDELSKLNAESPNTKMPEKTAESKKGSKKRKPDRTANRSIYQSTDRSIAQSTDRPTDQLTEIDALGPIVERPRAFYITQKVDRWLDEGVRYLREKGLHKADRSILVNALLHDPDLFIPGSLDKIRQRLLMHLTNKSLKRV